MNARLLLYHFAVSLLLVGLVHVVVAAGLVVAGVVRQSWAESFLPGVP
jgi:hypothetical protein